MGAAVLGGKIDVRFAKKLWGFKKGSFIDLRNLISDPRETSYFLKPGQKALINLPTDRGRVGRFYDLASERSVHPYVLASQRYLLGKKDDVYEVLKKYSEKFKINNANESLGLEEYSVFPKDGNPLAVVYPWESGDIKRKMRSRVEQVRKENKRYGYAGDSYLGSANCSDEKLNVEAKRICSLVDSIKVKGYVISDKSPLSAYIFVRDEDYTWMVGGGNHRAAILSSLGWESLPVFINGFVRREEVALWPAVKAGLYSEAAALSVFDRVFDARLPAVTEKWVDYVKSCCAQS